MAYCKAGFIVAIHCLEKSILSKMNVTPGPNIVYHPGHCTSLPTCDKLADSWIIYYHCQMPKVAVILSRLSNHTPRAQILRAIN